MTLQRKLQPGKQPQKTTKQRPKKERWSLSAGLWYFFHIVLLVLLWEAYKHLLEAYAQAVMARFLTQAQKEDVLTIFARGDWQTILEIPPALRQAPGWAYIIAAVLLIILGALLLWGYLVASRKLSNMLWDKFEARMKKLLRGELKRLLRIELYLIARAFRRILRDRIVSVSEESLPSDDTLPDEVPVDGRIPDVEIQLFLDHNSADFLPEEIRVRVPAPVRRLNAPRIVDSDPPLQLPEDRGDQSGQNRSNQDQ